MLKGYFFCEMMVILSMLLSCYYLIQKIWPKKEVKKKCWQPNIGLIFSLKDKFRIESLEIGPNKNSQLIFDELVKTIQWSKDSLFNKCCWNNGIFPLKKNESRYRPQTFHKNNLKWITDLNIKWKTRKVI